MKFHIGDTAEYSKTISDADARTFADLTGDYNPVRVCNKKLLPHTSIPKATRELDSYT
jgi:MaoC like domain